MNWNFSHAGKANDSDLFRRAVFQRQRSWSWIHLPPSGGAGLQVGPYKVEHLQAGPTAKPTEAGVERATVSVLRD